MGFVKQQVLDRVYDYCVNNRMIPYAVLNQASDLAFTNPDAKEMTYQEDFGDFEVTIKVKPSGFEEASKPPELPVLDKWCRVKDLNDYFNEDDLLKTVVLIKKKFPFEVTDDMTADDIGAKYLTLASICCDETGDALTFMDGEGEEMTPVMLLDYTYFKPVY